MARAAPVRAALHSRGPGGGGGPGGRGTGGGGLGCLGLGFFCDQRRWQREAQCASKAQ
jgi:hypothetical protein